MDTSKRSGWHLACTAVLLLVFGAAAAIAGPLDDVVKAFDRGDYTAAFRLARPLAEKGLPKAQNLLGYMYQSGKGAGQDYAKALNWYRKAADQGDAEGQNNVGVMYENGHGVWQDPSEAAKWYGKAADQGNPVAQNNLGILYAYGNGVQQDYVYAYVLFDLAASRFPQSDGNRREEALDNRDLVANSMTPSQMDDAQRLAREWKERNGRIGI